jgi:hypothetical protein
MMAGRNQHALDAHEIQYCQDAWAVLCGDIFRALDVSEAAISGSKTRFNESQQKVFLGADAYPGDGPNATSRMSPLACLAHELAHWERFEIDYSRPIEPPHSFLDEAETSIHASFNSVLGAKDREDLVEDARDRITDWLSQTRHKSP